MVDYFCRAQYWAKIVVYEGGKCYQTINFRSPDTSLLYQKMALENS